MALVEQVEAIKVWNMEVGDDGIKRLPVKLPQGLQPIGVAVNDMANMLVDDYVKQFNLDFPVGWSLREPVINFLQHPVMMMMSFPNLVIIDRNGQIRHQYPGGDAFFQNEEKNLREVLLPLLKAPAPAGARKAPAKKAN